MRSLAIEGTATIETQVGSLVCTAMHIRASTPTHEQAKAALRSRSIAHGRSVPYTIFDVRSNADDAKNSKNVVAE